MAAAENGKGLGSSSEAPAVENSGAATVLPGFRDADSFVKHALGTVVSATKASSGLPQPGDEYDFYRSFSGFQAYCEMQGERLLQCMSKVMQYHGCRSHLQDHSKVTELEDKFDLLVDANDVILERVGMLLDEAAGVNKNQQPVLPTGLQPPKTIVSSWNRKQNRDTNMRSNLETFRLLHAKNIVRPQLKFREKVDNSNTPFVPKLFVKPNALRPLPKALLKSRQERKERPEDLDVPAALADFLHQQRTQQSEQDMFAHPYRYELEHFSVPTEFLEKPQVQMFRPLTETPCHFISTLEELVELNEKLVGCKEFALDLEHHSYRSFLGLTCLMQISTRTEDFIIDPLELRSDLYILNETFTDPGSSAAQPRTPLSASSAEALLRRGCQEAISAGGLEDPVIFVPVVVGGAGFPMQGPLLSHSVPFALFSSLTSLAASGRARPMRARLPVQARLPIGPALWEGLRPRLPGARGWVAARTGGQVGLRSGPGREGGSGGRAAMEAAGAGGAVSPEGWFRETCSLWPGQALSLQVEEVLHHQRSPFQEILVFRSKTYGNVLVLDGVIQCTERDEFSYQEMIANLPLCSHPNPRKILIIGGGDGGVLREVVKHPSVESVIQCEIDEDVIQASKKYLPGMAVGYSSPKLTLHVGDGFEFMKQNQEAFDVIITDSSDPMGPAESLFKESYYQLMKTALREDGILCCQGECQWLHLDLIKEMRQFCKSLFPVVEYAYCTIPTYPSGQIGFMLCSKNPNTNFREPIQLLSQEQVENMSLKYYNSDVHRAAFVLPEFARKALSTV